MADKIIETRAAKCSDEFGGIDFLNDERTPVDHKALRQAEEGKPGLEAKFNRCVSCAMEVLKNEVGINPIRVADEVCYKAIVNPFEASETDLDKIFNPDNIDDLLKPPGSDFGTSF